MKDRRKFKFIIDLLVWTATIPVAYILRLEGQWFPYASDIGLLIIASAPIMAGIIYLLRLNRQS
ncbi:MAG: hypothetical protein ACOCUP_01855, partial [bacterium]